MLNFDRIAEQTGFSGFHSVIMADYSNILFGRFGNTEAVLKLSNYWSRSSISYHENEIRIYDSKPGWHGTRILRKLQSGIYTENESDMPYIIIEKMPHTIYESAVLARTQTFQESFVQLGYIAQTLAMFHLDRFVYQDGSLKNYYPLNEKGIIGDFGIMAKENEKRDEYLGMGKPLFAPAEQYDRHIFIENDVYTHGMCIMHAALLEYLDSLEFTSPYESNDGLYDVLDMMKTDLTTFRQKTMQNHKEITIQRFNRLTELLDLTFRNRTNRITMENLAYEMERGI